MEDLLSAVELINCNSHLADFAGQQPQARIASAERALGVAFSPSYKGFLAHFGCGGFNGLEFYGVVKDDFINSGVPDAVWLTLDLRRTAAMPHCYTLVSETGDGGFYAIDTSQENSSGESPVIEWWPGFPEADNNPRVVAADFGTFFLGEVRQASTRAENDKRSELFTTRAANSSDPLFFTDLADRAFADSQLFFAAAGVVPGKSVLPPAPVDKSWKNLIVGKAQKTGTAGHAFRSYREAIKMAESGQYDKIWLNRAFSTTTGTTMYPGRLPDIIARRKTGQNDVVEVPSKTNRDRDLFRRNEQAMD
ncbi:MAG: SMI1/KNR4 family protein, partial [Pirellulales bacterium]